LLLERGHEEYGGLTKKKMSKIVSEEEKHIVFSVTMPKNIVREIDRTRGFMPRSTWLRALAINELKRLQRLHPIGANQEEASHAAISATTPPTLPQVRRFVPLNDG
jgi:hypothetical protein